MGRVDILQECGSTNIEAADKERYSHGDAVIAVRQTAGRGQRGHKWDSREGENLTFSIVFEPTFLPVTEQFLLSEAVALAISDTLTCYGIDAAIKWTNDIYVGDRKICGTLIENDIKGANLSRSVVGIGLNVNQVDFQEWVKNPTSIAAEKGGDYDVMDVFHKLYDNLLHRYDTLASGGSDEIRGLYAQRLYRAGRTARYFIPSEGEVCGIIRGVENDGGLIVEIDGITRRFLFKEIEFII